MSMTDRNGEVFIVDDDPAVRGALSTVFARAGYAVTCFADGAALVAAARNGTPLCIILDVHIPGKSGLDILKQLNAQDYPVPIFMMSGQGDIAMAVDAIKNGALDFIEKPFRGSDVVARVEAAIEVHRQRTQNSPRTEKQRFYFPGRELLSRREQDVLAEIVNDDGTMQRRPDLEAFAAEHGLVLVTIADLIRYRRHREKLVRRVSQARIPTQYGDFTAHVFASLLDGTEHLAFVRGDVEGKSNVLVRVHSECLTGDVFGSLRCDCGVQLDRALEKVAREGEGVVERRQLPLREALATKASIAGVSVKTPRGVASAGTRPFGLIAR